MEVPAAVIGAILVEPCRFVFGYVQASIKNFSKRKTNFIALKNDMSSLMKLKDEVQQKLDLKDEQSGLVPGSKVEGWVRKVDELKTKMDEFQSTISTSDGFNLQDSCCPFPLQCKLSNKLARKIEEANQLMQDGNEMFEKMGDVRNKPNPVEHIPGPSIIGQKTASENLARVLDLLSNENVTRIGVWGKGGVGKTTLVRTLNNELGKMPSAQDFSLIIWVTVSKGTNLKSIQEQIVERLNLEVNMDRNEERIAIRIHERLLKEKRFLLILDDVWEVIDLDRVGIPRAEECPRSKIVITSRRLEVCRGMTQANHEVNVLNDKEAWELFCEHAGEVVKEEHIRPIAEKVARECDGLPLAIIVFGASMRWKSSTAQWNDALKALMMSELRIVGNDEDRVFKTLKWSYDSLERTHKFCFLFCCLYPEDFNIDVDELVRYWFCEGLLYNLEEHGNYEDVGNRGKAIIHSLRDCCLLEHDMDKNTVKMHDVVRDVGIRIADSVEGECRSLVRSGIGLTCVLENDLLDSHKRISFMFNKIVNLPDRIVQCQEVSTLLLQENWNLETVPASFLEGFHTLKILDLSGSIITSLPSLLQLNQLRALILSDCRRLRELPPLDGLNRLLLLDCSSSRITQLPESLEKLSNLRQLDVSDTSKLEIIPYRALSKLSNLELLKLPYVGEGQRLFEVLPLLNRLIVLHVELDSIPQKTSNNVNLFKRIKKFYIAIQPTVKYSWPSKPENSIILSGVCLSQEPIEWLLYNADNLKLCDCEGLTQMFIKLVADNFIFKSVKTLEITKSDVSFGGGVASSFDLLPNLEEITLWYLSKLESVSDLSKLLGLRFSRLKRIAILSCDQLKCVISLEENQTLEKLESIDVSYCKMLKSLFDYPNPTAQHTKQNPTAPNLQVVKLVDLPNLENLWENDESWQNVRELELLGCPKIRKLPLTHQNAESIEVIRGEKEWWNGLEWDSEDTKMLLQQRFRVMSLFMGGKVYVHRDG